MHRINFWHNCPFVVDNLNLRVKDFLDNVDPMEMKGFGSGGVMTVVR